MFDRLELSPALSRYLNSISPMLGITGNLENRKYFMITRYFSLKDERILVELSTNSAPKELSLNLLRKGEDPLLMAVLAHFPIEDKNFQLGEAVSVPIYVNSVISFECKLVKQLLSEVDSSIAIYKVVHACGVAGLDPEFNEQVTIAKTVEVMTLSAVDTYVINKKFREGSE